MFRILGLGLIFLAPPFAKIWLMRWFFGAKIGRKAHIGWFSAVDGKRITLGDHCVIRPLTLIRVLGDVTIGSYSEISSFILVYGSASLQVGDWCYIGPQSLINIDEDVVIGNESALGPRSMIFTHASFFPYTEGYWVRRAGVRLGNRVWCAAGAFLHPGVEIGDNSFINSRSVVTASIPPGSVAEGNPARVTYPMDRTVRKPTPRFVDLAARKVLHDFIDVGLQREMGIPARAITESEDQLAFRWHGKPYRVILVTSEGDLPPSEGWSSAERRIYVVNRPGWNPPQGSLSLDLMTCRTRYAPDLVHTGLRLFMLRYYGIRFADQD